MMHYKLNRQEVSGGHTPEGDADYLDAAFKQDEDRLGNLDDDGFGNEALNQEGEGTKKLKKHKKDKKKDKDKKKKDKQEKQRDEEQKPLFADPAPDAEIVGKKRRKRTISDDEDEDAGQKRQKVQED